MGLTPIYKSDDGWFNADAAQAAFELVMEMEPEEAEVFTTMVVADTLWDTIEKNQRTLQRHLDEVIAKQASTAMEVLSKRADGEEVAAAIAKALNPYDYGYRFDERDFNRDRRTGRFKTKIRYSATKPLDDKVAESYGIPKTSDPELKRVPKAMQAQHQQAYIQIANFLQNFQDNGLAGETDFVYTVQDGNRQYTLRQQDTSIPKVNPAKERIIEIEARPAGLTAAGASFGLVSALGGSDRAGWVAADKMNRFEAEDRGFNAFGQAWMDSGEEVSSSNDRLYGRVKAGSDFLGHMAYGNPKLEIAAKFGSLVGQHGPQAEKVIGPRARVTMYRYRGTEKTPDSDLAREYEKAMRSPENADGSEFGTRAQRLATAFMLRKVPDWHLYDLNLKAGHTPPSEGIIIDKNGKLVTQAIGYGDDHYLPFNLRNLAGLKGGEYIRTRSVGGPTSEDIYTGLVSGADRLTVVSRSGVFVVQFDDTFRGTRRYNDKAGRMVDRYEKLVDAVKSEQVSRQPLERSVRQAIRDEVDRTAGFMPAKERERLIARKEQEYKMYPRITKEDEARIEASVGSLAQDSPLEAEKMRRQLRNELLESKSYNFKLNGDGYAAALNALQEQFPYYIADVRYVARNEDSPYSTETDRGYVKPRHNRPDGALEGYYDAQIAGKPKTALEGLENTGKFRASEADYQNWKNNTQNPQGKFVPLPRQTPATTPSTSEPEEAGATQARTPASGSRAEQVATQLRNQERADAFATKALEVRNFLALNQGGPRTKDDRGFDLFQMDENDFKEAIKTRPEDLEFWMDRVKGKIIGDPDYADGVKAFNAYYSAKGSGGGVPFDPARHLNAKPTRPFSFKDDAVYAEGAKRDAKIAELTKVALRNNLPTQPLNRIKDDEVFKTEIERLQNMRRFSRNIAGENPETLIDLRASGMLGDWSDDEVAAMLEPEKIDAAIIDTHRAWTLTTHIMNDETWLEQAFKGTATEATGELPKVVKRPEGGAQIVMPPSNMGDKAEAAAEYERLAKLVGDRADQLDPTDPEYTKLSELANMLYTSRKRPEHIQSRKVWEAYQKYESGDDSWWDDVKDFNP